MRGGGKDERSTVVEILRFVTDYGSDCLSVRTLDFYFT